MSCKVNKENECKLKDAFSSDHDPGTEHHKYCFFSHSYEMYTVLPTLPPIANQNSYSLPTSYTFQATQILKKCSLYVYPLQGRLTLDIALIELMAGYTTVPSWRGKISMYLH